MSTEEAEETQSAFGDGGGGPGAPTPLAVLEARSFNASNVSNSTDSTHQGVAGLSARDIKLIVDGGFNTVESVAYTWVNSRDDMLWNTAEIAQTPKSIGTDQRHLRTKSHQNTSRRSTPPPSPPIPTTSLTPSRQYSLQARPHGLHHRY